MEPTAPHPDDDAMTQENQAVRRRRITRIVGDYLAALDASKRGPGRPRRPDKPEDLEQRLAVISDRIDNAVDPLDRLRAVQERMDLQARLSVALAPDPADDLDELRAQVVEVLAEFCQYRGITWRALIEVGVPRDVLREAGVVP